MFTDEAIRRKALTPSESFIVQAPAGSGKTELLVQRYLTLLASVNAPEEILAITFTRKAAAEMRYRVLEALKKGEAQEPDQVHAKLTWQLAQRALARDQELAWKLIQNPERMRIETIDAFCGRLASRLPVLSKLGNMPEILTDADHLYKKAIFSFFADLEKSESWSESIAHLMLHFDNRLDQLETVLMAMLRRREQWLAVLPRAARHFDLKQNLEKAIEGVRAEALLKVQSLISPEFISLIFRLMAYAYRNLNQSFESDPHSHETWAKVAQIVLTQTGELRKLVDKRQGFLNPKEADNESLKAEWAEHKECMGLLLEELAQQEEWIKALRHVRRVPEPEFTAEDWESLSHLLQVLPVLLAHLQVVFLEEREVDFNEISLRALQSLGEDENPTDLALSLDYQIRHILVDEFQDTSDQQYRLLLALTRGWEPLDGRTLFFVGDPMQSIYRFRQADVSLFLKTAKEGLGSLPITLLQLSSNFRSAPEIVEWVNQIFQAIFPKAADELVGAMPYHASQATQQHQGQVHFLRYTSELEEAESVVSLADQCRREGDPGTTIAILGRTRAQLHFIMQMLNHYRLPYQGVEMQSLASRMTVLDLLSLLYALQHLGDRLSALALLRSPWIGLGLQDVHRIAEHSRFTTVLNTLEDPSVQSLLTEAGQAEVKRVVPILNKARRMRGEMPLRIWLEQAWRELGGMESLRNESELLETMQFFDVLETLTPMCLFNREMLEEKISRLYATSQIDHHEGPMIQVMTIHKAKGLEFDHVFIPALERSARPEEQPLLLWQEQYVEGEWKMLLAPIKRRERAEHSALYRFLYELEQEKAFFESQRLLYVATTRAKKALYLSAATGDEPDFKPSKNSFLSWIWPYVTTHFHPAPQMPLKPQQERLAMPTEEPERVPFEANLRGSLSSVYSIESEENQDLNIPEFPHQHCPVERAIGIVVHRYLAEIADQHLQGWQQTHFEVHKTFIAAQLRQEGVLSIGLDQATNEVIALLNQVIRDEKALWILSPHEESACELVLTEVQGERVQTRVIDRTFVDQGIRWIIDYKTADLPPEAPLDAFLEREWERYQPQLQLYARLMRALEGGRYPIKTALYFVRQGLLKVETEVLSDAMV